MDSTYINFNIVPVDLSGSNTVLYLDALQEYCRNPVRNLDVIFLVGPLWGWTGRHVCKSRYQSIRLDVGPGYLLETRSLSWLEWTVWK